MDTNDKTREIRLRRAAERQGMTLHKSRVRDPRAIGYGLFHVADGNNNVLAGGGLLGFSMNLDEIEVYLAGVDDLDVYFENPLGDYWGGERPILEWTGRGWLLSERTDSPRDHLFGGLRTDLVYVATQARAVLKEWSCED